MFLTAVQYAIISLNMDFLYLAIITPAPEHSSLYWKDKIGERPE